MIFCGLMIIIALAMIKSKSKLIANILIMLLCIISITNNNLPDISIYESRFNYYQEMSSYSEFGFTQLIHCFHLLGLDFFWFRTFIILAFLLTIRWFVMKHTSHCAFVIAMYAIFSYCIDVVQLRNSLAMIFVIYGIDVLITDKSKYCNMKFLISILFATSMHFTAIFYVLLIAVKYLSLVKTWICLAISSSVIFIMYASKTWIMKLFTLVISEERIYMILDFASRYQFTRVVNFQLGSIFCTLLVLTLLYLSRRKLKRNIYESEDSYILVDYVSKFQILSLVIVPLFFISVDLYRIPRNMLWLGYLAFMPDLIKLHNSSMIFESLFNKLLILGMVVMLFIVQIYGMGNFEDVFIPLFFN